MLKLAPSLLSANFSNLSQDILKIEKAGAHYLHLDVMDGHFVPNITFGVPIIKSIRKTTDMTFDVHLMISDPDRYLEDFANAGADIINVHIEACKNIKETITRIKSLNKRAAIAIKPNTSLESVYEVLDQLDLVLVMSVEPGFGGQSIMPHTLKKAETLANYISKNNLLTEIEMDGGIYLENLKDVLSVGVNVVVAGTAVFGNEDVDRAVKDFYEAFNTNPRLIHGQQKEAERRKT